MAESDKKPTNSQASSKLEIPDDLEQKAIQETTALALNQINNSEASLLSSLNTPIVGFRGAQIFNYEEVHKRYEEGRPIKRLLALI